MFRHAVLVLFLVACPAARPAVALVPESQQARLALNVINAWRGNRNPGPPKKLHVVYYTPRARAWARFLAAALRGAVG